MDVCNINDIKALLNRHGFHFSKSMGQNFLIESWVPEDIAAASGADSGCCALEIGPGIGPLTRQLSARAGKVVAVELDRSLLPILAETLSDRDNVQIIPGDIMKLDVPALVEEHFGGLTPIACANLPYNITSPVLTLLIESKCFASITVMIQREVGLRICAAPGSSDYGAFSVFCQYHTQPELLFDVPPTCFIPAPKVTSCVIRMVPRPKPEEVGDEAFFFRVVRAAFAQRRKTLLNSLSSSLGQPFSREMIAQAIDQCGLKADVRGERLGISEFARLAHCLKSYTV
ncbi:MAG: 16S rRNA (adenine(1518)-N(6)/adenine(1519)-N(6))-dimethyltransferase RsmA [Oscillospiraceae bacterium]|nr:16S rRNA (adenine(1518)-N(6)/adenine(1519)-N(6))-dimethyltransferase RsmA [Oscillospiraceae bacterium]